MKQRYAFETTGEITDVSTVVDITDIGTADDSAMDPAFTYNHFGVKVINKSFDNNIQHEIDKCIGFIKNRLIKQYMLSPEDAVAAIAKARLKTIFDENWEQALHTSVDKWARDVYLQWINNRGRIKYILFRKRHRK